MMGKEYSTQLLMPLGLTSLFLMLNNGFDVKLVSSLMLLSVNEKSCSRSATETTRNEFYNALHALGSLTDRKLITTVSSRYTLLEENPYIVLNIHPEALETEEFNILVKELGLEHKAGPIKMRFGFRETKHELAVNTRSFLALLNYLSNFIDYPEEHQQRVWPTTIELEKEPIHIYSSTKIPQDANTAVYLYNTWFYIKNEDVVSQNTLYLIQILFNLQAQVGSSSDNVQLSLPVR